MMIVTICPRCNQEFAYTPYQDFHLTIPVAWDEQSGEPCSFETICEECYLKENPNYNNRNNER